MELIGKSLKHYRIDRRLGEGGMGVVYLATDTELGREVALKVLPEAMAADADRLQRFRQEAKAIAALSHPNIVTVFSVEQVPSPSSGQALHFITMELVRGRGLAERIGKGGMPVERLLEVAVPLASAVAAAHRRGIVHRDLKPDNVLIDDEDGRLRVLDFGLAKLDPALGEDPGATVTQEGTLLGTVAYMSPEQAQGKAVEPTSDVFSLGVLLYEMATGENPFRGENPLSTLTSIMRDEPRPVSDVAARPVGPLDSIIARCLGKDPADRYPTAAELAVDLERLRASMVSGSAPAPATGNVAATRRPRRRWIGRVAFVLLAVVGVAAVSTWLVQRNRRLEWARSEAIPRIQQLRAQSTWLEWGTAAWDAHELATEAAAVLGDDPMLEQEWSRVTNAIDVTSEPPGAEVWAKAYTDLDGAWRRIGRTPLEDTRFPAGTSRLRVELPGHRAAYDVVLNIGYLGDTWHFPLQPEGTVPEGMVYVPGGEHELMLPGVDHLEARPTDPFLIDRYEVTNRQYKKFLDAGGYTNPDYWVHPFDDDGRTLSFEQAIRRFRDATDRTGPAGWEVGGYPSGTDDLPVSGVSWFEAEAYAQWAGKRLPTIYHWNQAALTWASGSIVPLSNFTGNGAWPTGSTRSMNRFGVFDMAGNVREWCSTGIEARDGRFILGGGWNDAGWAFNDAYAQSPWDRQPTNGFRCVRTVDPGDFREDLTRPVAMPFRDFYNEEPVPDETFALFLRQFEYDPTPLDARIESEDDQGDWTRQRLSFDAAYGDERVQAWLYVPKTAAPHPAIVIFPGSNAIHTESSEGLTGDRFAYFMKSGRTVIFPIYKGTYERGDDLDSDYPEETNFYKDHVVMWGKDLSRAIDYLETRDDIDTSRLTFSGYSWGGVMGTILPAVEPRIKVNLLYVAGLLFQKALPEVDQINYVGRVRQPTLMINGEFDFFFPVETAQKPMVDLLGTPDEHKRYVVFPGSHSVPRTELAREFLAWLDRYQPVR